MQRSSVNSDVMVNVASLSNGRLALCFSSRVYHWMGNCSILPSGGLFFVLHLSSVRTRLIMTVSISALGCESSCESVSISAFQCKRLLPLRLGSGRRKSPSDSFLPQTVRIWSPSPPLEGLHRGGSSSLFSPSPQQTCFHFQQA